MIALETVLYFGALHVLSDVELIKEYFFYKKEGL
jgi:hypothetical protein